ncbi:hypothetical protein [Achromobacter xylosoxidans]|uniref:Uncharacterized protein n=1 Tax=Alcaligenes xylosoxydans xylosoxydans TaxID=85698 RepID=A0A1R1JX52_ALCXX|nr:hypothetical protein [Achromobacter xylosoxidans]OMG90710.1 hypothetical protein BIZ92_20595 [Achromobacter xylosoxidans]
MTLDTIVTDAINPTLALLPAAMDTPAARVMLLAIGLQESRFVRRRQIGGPARETMCSSQYPRLRRIAPAAKRENGPLRSWPNTRQCRWDPRRLQR